MEKFTKVCIFFVIASLCLNAIVPADSAAVFYDESRIVKRSDYKSDTICAPGNPCGWAAYDSEVGSKPIRYFMRNTCKCPEEIKCIRTNEDLSTATYVYRCQYPDTTTETTL